MTEVKHIRLESGKDFFILTNLEKIEKTLKQLVSQPVVGFDIETYGKVKVPAEYKTSAGLHPSTGDIRLLSFSNGVCTYLIDTFYVSDVYPLLKPLFEAEQGPTIVGAHLDFDLMFLMAKNILPNPRRLADVADMYKLYRESGGRYLSSKLIDIAAYFGYVIDKTQQGSDWGKRSLDSKQYEYSAIDSYVVVLLYHELLPLLKKKRLIEPFLIESGATAAVAHMRNKGVCIDVDYWMSFANETEKKLNQVKEELREIVQSRIENFFFDVTNLQSAEQAKIFLHRMGIKAENTSEDYLKNKFYDDPFIQKFLEFRQLSKLYTAFGPDFLTHYVLNGKVYPSWYKFDTVTGRMSCKTPNLQQIPRNEIRRAFIPSKGKLMVKADYSQIELRLAAIVAEEFVLLHKYRNLEDVHAYTASQIFGIDLDEVTKKQRAVGKTVNFSLLYGMGANGLQRRLKAEANVDYDIEDVEDIRQSFFQAYPSLRQWHRHIGYLMREYNYVYTLTGRRRAVTEDEFTAAVNFPVQGLAAEGQKLALVRLYQAMRGNPQYGINILLAIHDEIVIEAYEDHIEQAKNLLVSIMAESMRYVCRNADYLHSVEVPDNVLVEATICKNWYGDPITN